LLVSISAAATQFTPSILDAKCAFVAGGRWGKVEHPCIYDSQLKMKERRKAEGDYRASGPSPPTAVSDFELHWYIYM
jgi:RES domain-containing protein